MRKEERQAQLLALIEQNETLTPQQLAQRLGISIATIRRDLKQLANQGLLHRTWGRTSLRSAPSLYQRRLHSHSAEKRAIAKAACRFLQEGASIYLDSGTTTLAVAHELQHVGTMNVVTNDLHIAHALVGNPELIVQLCGGTVRRDTETLVGGAALDSIRALRVEIAFMAASAVNLTYGVSNIDPFEAEVKKEVLTRAQKKILLVDSSKFGRTLASRWAPLEAFDGVITDPHLSPAVLQALHQTGLQVVIAEMETDASTEFAEQKDRSEHW